MLHLQLLYAVLLFLRTTFALPAHDLVSRAEQISAPYVFATFWAENESNPNEKTALNIYTSEDGIELEEYALDVYQPKNGILRDPSIIFYLGKYYIAHTTDWYSQWIAIISSTDLKNWQHVVSIDMGGGVAQSWAPVGNIFLTAVSSMNH